MKNLKKHENNKENKKEKKEKKEKNEKKELSFIYYFLFLQEQIKGIIIALAYVSWESRSARTAEREKSTRRRPALPESRPGEGGGWALGMRVHRSRRWPDSRRRLPGEPKRRSARSADAHAAPKRAQSRRTRAADVESSASPPSHGRVAGGAPRGLEQDLEHEVQVPARAARVEHGLACALAEEGELCGLAHVLPAERRVEPALRRERERGHRRRIHGRGLLYARRTPGVVCFDLIYTSAGEYMEV